MEYVVGGISLAVVGVVAVLFFLATRDTRDLAKKLAAAQKMALEAEVRATECEGELASQEGYYLEQLKAERREKDVLRAELQDFEQLLARTGVPDVIYHRLLQVLAKAAPASPSGDFED